MIQFNSFSHSVLSDSLWSYGLQHARLLCPSPTPRAYSNSCPSSQWCHPAFSFSVVPFSSCLKSFPAWGSFQMNQLGTHTDWKWRAGERKDIQMNQLLAWGGQSIGVSASASVLPMNIQDWFPLEFTGFISLQSKELSRVFNTTVQKHQFFEAQLSL